MVAQQNQLFLNLAWAKKVVCIEVLNEVTLGLGQRPISSRSGTAVAFTDNFDSSAFVPLANRESLIFGSIVNQNHFRARPRLVQCRLECRGHKSFCVIGWNKDGDLLSH